MANVMEQMVDETGRIVLPKPVRTAVGLLPGTVAEIRVVEGGVLITPKRRGGRTKEFLRHAAELRQRHRVRLSKEEILDLCDRALEDL